MTAIKIKNNANQKMKITKNVKKDVKIILIIAMMINIKNVKIRNLKINVNKEKNVINIKIKSNVKNVNKIHQVIVAMIISIKNAKRKKMKNAMTIINKCQKKIVK